LNVVVRQWVETNSLKMFNSQVDGLREPRQTDHHIQNNSFRSKLCNKRSLLTTSSQQAKTYR